MFVVEAGSGKNKGYATASELGAAIRRGELGPQAKIYHRATDRWLPITVHPEYRRAAAEREAISGMELQQRQWTFLPESQSQADRKAAAARGDAQAQNTPGPTSADPAPSWLGSRLRRLRGIAHL